MKLTSDQYNALNKATHQTKTDCWFWIEEKDDEDIVKDLEDDTVLDWREALKDLKAAIEVYSPRLKLTEEERKGLIELYKQYRINLHI